jgi:hypothetical protein
LVRKITRYWTSSKQNIKNKNQEKSRETKHFEDIEEAEFREIPIKKKKESEDN